MFLIKAGNPDSQDFKMLELKGQSRDFEQAKIKANKLLVTFSQIEIIDSETNQCVHFQIRENS